MPAAQKQDVVRHLNFSAEATAKASTEAFGYTMHADEGAVWHGPVHWSWQKHAKACGSFTGMLCKVLSVAAGQKWKSTGNQSCKSTTTWCVLRKYSPFNMLQSPPQACSLFFPAMIIVPSIIPADTCACL